MDYHVSWTTYISFFLYLIVAIFSFNKIGGFEKKRNWERAAVIITFLIACFGLILQEKTSYESVMKGNLEQRQHREEKAESNKSFERITKQNNSLKDSIKIISGNNQKLLVTVYNLSSLYKQNVKLQDSVNEYTTGGYNVPLLTAEAQTDDFNDPNNNYKMYKMVIMQFYIKNKGDVPIYNLRYIFNNPLTYDYLAGEKTVSAIEAHGIHLIAFDYQKDIFQFPLSVMRRDTMPFLFQVSWTGRKLNYYSSEIDLIKHPDGSVNIKQTFSNKKGEVFDLKKLIEEELKEKLKSASKRVNHFN